MDGNWNKWWLAPLLLIGIVIDRLIGWYRRARRWLSGK